MFGKHGNPKTGSGGAAGCQPVALAADVFWGSVRGRDLAFFTRQLATLIEAGMPLVRGLRLLARQEANPVFKRGDTLTEPLAASDLFPPTLIGMIDVGERRPEPCRKCY